MPDEPRAFSSARKRIEQLRVLRMRPTHPVVEHLSPNTRDGEFCKKAPIERQA
jgi:hypothetical protein